MSNSSVSLNTMMSLREYITYSRTYNLTDEWGWFVDIESNQQKYVSKPKKNIHTMPTIKEVPSVKNLSSMQQLNTNQQPEDNNLMLCFSGMCFIMIIIFYYDYF